MKNPHIFVLLAFLILAGMIVSPALAYSYTYYAPSGKAIEIITVVSQGGTSATIGIHQANNDTITGSWDYEPNSVMLLPMHAIVALGSETKTFDYILPGTLTTGIWSTGNVSNIMKLRMGIGQTAAIYNAVVETDMAGSPIIGFTIDSNKEVTTDEILVPFAAADKAMTPESGEDIITKVKGYWDQAWGIFTALAYWLKFLFWDHLIALVVLYLTGTMAYYMNTSKNIFIFYTRWFKGLAGLFHFIANIYSIVISIITQIAQALKLL